MSSSPKRALIHDSVATRGHTPARETREFVYCDVEAHTGQEQLGQAAPVDSSAADAGREAQLRELGRQQGFLESRAKFEEQLAAERGALAKALTDFSRERTAYYQRIEEEAVRLALSIARKVLHRESQVDPFLLMGIVRVALERIEGATGVALLVHPQQAGEWRRYLGARLQPGDMPQIVEDPAMSLQQCGLRTAMGVADLGLEVQLSEIEKGLTDLLAARPDRNPSKANLADQ